MGNCSDTADTSQPKQDAQTNANNTTTPNVQKATTVNTTTQNTQNATATTTKPAQTTVTTQNSGREIHQQ